MIKGYQKGDENSGNVSASGWVRSSSTMHVIKIKKQLKYEIEIGEIGDGTAETLSDNRKW